MTLPRLTVGVLTFRRPSQLRANLEGVRTHVLDALEGLSGARVLVVDNDPEASARRIVDDLRRESAGQPVPVIYVHEPRPGIATARNRAMRESACDRLLVFIDDDEIPQPGWLTSLLDVWRRTEASAVVGRVVPRLPPHVDPWVASSGFFQRTTHATGTIVAAAPTNNLLLDLDAVRELGVQFDETLGLAGGEDTLFTRTLTRRGDKIVWCRESVAIDPIVPERATREWVLRRAYSHGNVLQQTRLRLETSPAGRVRAQLVGVVGGVARIGVAAAQRIWAASTGSAERVQRSEILLRRGWGVLAGAMGHRHEEYRRTRDAP